MDDAPIIYGLEDFQARALVAQAAETEKICFLVGTQSLTATNQVQVIEYDDDSGLVSKKSYDHPGGEVWGLASAPQSPALLATVYSNSQQQVTEAACAVWRLPLDSGPATGSLEETRINLELVADLKEPAADGATSAGVRWVGWSSESDNRLATLTPSNLLLWDLRPDGSSAAVSSRGEAGGSGGRAGVGGLGVGRWYPHQQAVQVAATLGPSVVAWDTRTMSQAWTLPSAHLHTVRDLDFNPNLQYHVATCGDDCGTKFWDLRKSTTPLLSLRHHSHWVWSVRYNASYDQLVLTCSSDQRIVLSNLPSVAAMPFGDSQPDDPDSRGTSSSIPEGVVQTYEEHEDSVYAVEWAAGDFWTFASLSYDGRLVINKVPRAVKYKQFL